jgi:demethylmenaquinone methyltransferase/2-methoxy-6-polyprenyl-1,4-benzoquinol methylase
MGVLSRLMSKPALEDAFVTPETKRAYNRRLFGTIADRYDFITRFLSFGLDQRWKSQLVELCDVRPGQRVLDLACGTGDIALMTATKGARAIGLDLTPRMIELARAKAGASPGGGEVRWMVGDMGRLPIAPASVDLVTTGYGLRNVPDLTAALAEIARVLRPGGLLGALDFDKPESPALRRVYLAHLTLVGGTLGRVLHGDPDTYRYIPASIRRYPGARGVVQVAADLSAAATKSRTAARLAASASLTSAM